ncbi:efflux RND transporter periplasmic adaptor subunit [Brevibacillus dissolubilis]|uniref:efflux RND transporter periplasmic adaptor subunit n=1 Tax=Brevibacillus dissolubilis TaxID=1844116 RepID=UPI001116C825|nr:efflux RND transporter periplasmic adaptor subunit [Brevibacillus dissolubilis]
MNRWLILSVAALVFASGCEKLETEVQKQRDLEQRFSEDAEQVLKVKTVQGYVVQQGQEALTQETYGVLSPGKEISLSFGSSGKISSLRVKKGDYVKSGAILATLDTAALEQEIAAAQSEVQRAHASKSKTLQGPDQYDVTNQQLQVQKAQQNLTHAQTERETAQRLYDSGVISREELDAKLRQEKQMTIALQEERTALSKLMQSVDQADVQAVDASVRQAQAQLQRARQGLQGGQLIAPFAGVIAEVSQQTAEQTGPGQSVLKLIDAKQWVVKLSVNSEQISNWQTGKKVSLTAPSGGQKEGIVTFVSAVMDETTGTYPVEITLQGEAGGWRAGQMVTCRYELQSTHSLFIPVSAVGISDEEHYVMLIDNQVAKKHPVQVGALYGDMYEITEGLKINDQIVRTGLSYVSDGETVQVAGYE